MDIRNIKKIIEMFNETPDIANLEIQDGEQSVCISRATAHINTSIAPPAMQPAVAAAAEPAAVAQTAEPQQLNGHTVRSPMVGTLYSSASPDSPPFVKTGVKVKAGDTLCIIEAMKMFNEIEADKSGKIIAVLAENGQTIEYDQPLFIIEE